MSMKTVRAIWDFLFGTEADEEDEDEEEDEE
jgi:hypothetical protein